VQQAAVAILAVVMMLAIGLRSDPRDFAVALRRPSTFLLSLLINLVVVPFVALLVLRTSKLPNAVVVGILICAASPAGAVGPLFTMRAGGHVATAVVTMTALTLLGAIATPPLLSWTIGVSVAIDTGHLVLPMMRTLLVLQLAPLLVGMAIRRWRAGWASRLAPLANRLANVLLLVVVIGFAVTRGHALVEVGAVGVALSGIVVLVSLALGGLVTRVVPERRAYSLVTGARNIALALVVGSSYFPDPLTEATILTFGLCTMTLPLAAAWGMRRGDRGASP
jgi:BASS family bile acid:Na+ symporter